jgi:hypothetical protein
VTEAPSSSFAGTVGNKSTSGWVTFKIWTCGAPSCPAGQKRVRDRAGSVAVATRTRRRRRISYALPSLGARIKSISIDSLCFIFYHIFLDRGYGTIFIIYFLMHSVLYT